MKNWHRFLIAMVFAGTIAATGVASFSLPGEVYRMDSLNQAADVAREKGLPIAFIYTNEGTTCGLATAATADLVESLKDCSVLVYVCSEGEQDWEKAPDIFRRAANSPQSGKFIPKAVIVDGDMKKLLAIVPYVRDVDARKQYLHKVRAAIQK